MPSRISQMRSGQTPMSSQTPQLNEQYIQQLKNIMRSNDPMSFLQQAFSQNPRLAPILQLLSSGGNPQIIYENLARQMNTDPNLILNKLMS